MMDLIIKNARLRGKDGLFQIGINAGRIAEIQVKIDAPAKQEIDAEGRLVTAGFVNPHMHLDKALLGEQAKNLSATFEEAIRLTIDRKLHYSVDEICQRAQAVIDMAILAGTTAMRGFADVDPYGGLRPVEALLKLRELNRGIIDLQVVAFPQEGIVRQPGTEELLRQAMEMGADVVGGIPWYEFDEYDARAHIDTVFKIAKDFKADVHMLVDDTDDPTSRTLEIVALATIRYGYQGRVTASHSEALAAYDDYHAARVVRMVAEAGISICCNPHINLVLNGRRDKQPVRRGITRVKELLGAGINICSGQDDVNDPYYPFGRCDQLEVASFVAHTAQLTFPNEIETVFDMVTLNAARAMQLSDYGLEVGKTADLVVLDATSAAEAIRTQAVRRYVIKGGCVVAENSITRKLARDSQG
ncbi:Amidohydrolase 3 [Moorella glycerini]|uniref:Cytosine deaminase n=1 Tax=Neomoorella stamsii TaxID=1266720 RepID=A0A9X7J4N6_9FIRM|nr:MULTISPECIES: amidohydrolase family protein [Moorella]PRR73422.1 Cytosine deaminase [Moorella stamsii]CEP69191.1 Amidohydrolase 3 [Moorella glycerini]